MTKKIIPVEVDTISPYEFEATLGSLLTTIQAWIDLYGSSARVDYSSSGSMYSDSPRFKILVEREETDVQYKLRVETEGKHQALRDAQDLRDFERLSKKFKEKK